VLNSGELPLPYPAYVVIGTLLWAAFSDAISSPMKSMTSAKSMLSKINFPREALLMAGLLGVFLNLLIRLVLMVAVFAYYQILPPLTAPLAILGVLGIVCLGFTIGLLLTPVGMLYTDIGQALTMILSFWMLFTPVVYAPPTTGVFAVVSRLNPVSPLVVMTREWLAVGPATQIVPGLIVFLASAVLLIMAWVIYRLTMPILVERMGG
jgi:lipopolysaccharide transport system permease protein